LGGKKRERARLSWDLPFAFLAGEKERSVKRELCPKNRRNGMGD